MRETSAASALIHGIYRLDSWLTVGLALLPSSLPMRAVEPADLPRVSRDVRQGAEAIRTLALPALEEGWMESLLRAPLSKEEPKEVIWSQCGVDELRVIREPAAIGP